MVPEVPITRSNPALTICLQMPSTPLRTCLARRRSSRPLSGSLLTYACVRRITPSFTLRASRRLVASPSVSSTLPPPISMTTARDAPTSTP